MNKYRAVKTRIGNIIFDSKAEAQRYQELILLQKAGEIKGLILQPQFLLQESFRYYGKAIRAITYIADFQYFDIKTSQVIVEDVKGMETREFQIKKKLFLKQYGDRVQFRIIKKGNRKEQQKRVVGANEEGGKT